MKMSEPPKQHFTCLINHTQRSTLRSLIFPFPSSQNGQQETKLWGWKAPHFTCSTAPFLHTRACTLILRTRTLQPTSTHRWEQNTWTCPPRRSSKWQHGYCHWLTSIKVYMCVGVRLCARVQQMCSCPKLDMPSDAFLLCHFNSALRLPMDGQVNEYRQEEDGRKVKEKEKRWQIDDERKTEERRQGKQTVWRKARKRKERR